jgi:hypothetical protein
VALVRVDVRTTSSGVHGQSGRLVAVAQRMRLDLHESLGVHVLRRNADVNECRRAGVDRRAGPAEEELPASEVGWRVTAQDVGGQPAGPPAGALPNGVAG